MSEDLIKRSDAIEAIHNYWKKCLDTLPTADIQQTDKILEHNKTLCNFINAIPSTDRPNEVIYGNEHNCIMTIFGECSYAETGCGDCAVVEKVRKALSADRLQEEWIEHKWIEYNEELMLEMPMHNYECPKCHSILHEARNYCPDCGVRMKGADDEV